MRGGVDLDGFREASMRIFALGPFAVTSIETTGELDRYSQELTMRLAQVKFVHGIRPPVVVTLRILHGGSPLPMVVGDVPARPAVEPQPTQLDRIETMLKHMTSKRSV